MADESLPAAGIISRWRIREDEVQVNQALTVVCQDPKVARAFVCALLEIAGTQPETADPASRALERLPDDLTCEEQSHLPEQRRRTLLHERRHVGIVDLDFTGDNGRFRLLVELKINASLGRGDGDQTQADVYTKDHLVLAVARVPLPPPTAHGDNWLGTVRWSELAPHLETLPITTDSLRSQWRELLAVMRDDGDFYEQAPKSSRSTAEALDWLDANKTAFGKVLVEAITASDRNGGRSNERQAFADAIRLKASASRDSAFLAFRLPQGIDAGPIWFVMVPSYAPAPKATVIWWPPRLPRAWKRGEREADRQAHQHLRDSGFEPHPTNYSYRRMIKPPRDVVRDVGLDAFHTELNRALATIGESGVLKACVENYSRR